MGAYPYRGVHQQVSVIMRVLHVITTMDRGGAENHVLTLASAQREKGDEVRIAFLKGTGELVVADDESTRLSPRSIRSLRQWVRTGGVVHAHLPRAELVAARLTPRSTPFIVSRHNTEPFHGSAPARVSRGLSRWSTRRADSVIAISESVKNYHLRTGHLNPDARIEVIPYGYSSSDASPLPYDWSSGRESNSRPLRIATVARLTPQKDLPTLLRSIALLKKRGLGIDLRIAGDGPDKASLSELIEHLDLASSVRMIGRISNPEQFIAGADIFALPSRYEGLGLVLLEAMAVKTPIVAARNTAIKEVVLDSETGLLFETGSADDLAAKLIRVANSSELADRLVNAGSQRLLEHYSVDRMFMQTMDVYEAALGRVR